MKLATFVAANGRPTLGCVDTRRGAILDLAAASMLAAGTADPIFASMLDPIEAGPAGLDRARALGRSWPRAAELALAGTALMSPLPVPPQMRDCLVFEQHLVNATAQWEKMTGKPAAPVPEVWYQRPTWYKCNRFSVVGTETDVIWPPYAELMDFELRAGDGDRPQGQGHPGRGRAGRTSSASPSSTTSPPATCRSRAPARHGPDEGQGLRHRQRARPVDRDTRRDRGSADPEHGSARQRRALGRRQFARHASLVRRRSSPSSRAPRRSIRASSSRRARCRPAAASSSAQFLRRATWSSSRSRRSASCATASCAPRGLH